MAHIAFILTGFAVVMGVLALLWGVMVVIGRGAALFQARKAPATLPTPSISTASNQTPPHHLVAIAVAVAVVTGGRGRVTHVLAAPNRAPAWAMAGRTELHHTHALRRGFGLTRTKESENDP